MSNPCADEPDGVHAGVRAGIRVRAGICVRAGVRVTGERTDELKAEICIANNVDRVGQGGAN
ncbi:MAG TPA: hypothetical protein VGO47_13420 [Chlamydiales bacterium]|nr:hypothetical protein [Chlamydiales bacterium]